MRSRKRIKVISLSVGVLIAALVAVLATRHSVSEGAQVKSDLGGKTAPNISGADILGGKSLSLYAMLNGNRYVLVDFFASWCTTCQQDMAQLEDFSFHDAKKVSVLGVDIEDTAANGASFLRSYGATWPAVEDTQGANSTAVAYGVSSPPEMFLIGPNRKVLAYFVGGATDAQLNTALQDVMRAYPHL
jgi:cytochrome c biogenesis protein CcmG/thiol:disulfide interchange protein DsbE